MFQPKISFQASHQSGVNVTYSACAGSQDDTKVLLAKAEVSHLLDTVQKQQQQFLDLPNQLALEPTIPIPSLR
ncbi:hypothetical protein C0Q70_16977 [Pomacea canaliculata]|uniref:Uncharacterized protein n=1 Tax=Pomacea canaliculata TaxID=400727 RepID=A0A2T7NRA4_POMCA|nr:hypothetical protein C0Q70_16977 [Pomacea canaliculata]